MDPAHLRAQADSLDGEAIELARGGDVLKGIAKAAEAIRLRQLADAVEALIGTGQARTVYSDLVMTDAHRAALGTSRPGHASKFRAWIANADGKRPHRAFSLRALAQEARTSPSSLSQAQRPKTDHLARPIRPDVARRVEKLTGWPADAAHWPAGIQDE